MEIVNIHQNVKLNCDDKSVLYLTIIIFFVCKVFNMRSRLHIIIGSIQLNLYTELLYNQHSEWTTGALQKVSHYPSHLSNMLSIHMHSRN